MAFTMGPILLVEQRARLRIRQDFRRAKARSPGTRRRAWSRLNAW